MKNKYFPILLSLLPVMIVLMTQCRFDDNGFDNTRISTSDYDEIEIIKKFNPYNEENIKGLVSQERVLV